MEYTVVDVKQLGEANEYGTPYNVDFEEEKGVFMLAKRAPEAGTKEVGNITDAPKKSGTGTYRRFKREQQQSFQASAPRVKAEDPGRQDSIIRQSSLKAAVELVVADKVKFTELFDFADEVVKWVKDESKVEPPKQETLTDAINKKVDNDLDGINLDDIPF